VGKDSDKKQKSNIFHNNKNNSNYPANSAHALRHYGAKSFIQVSAVDNLLTD